MGQYYIPLLVDRAGDITTLFSHKFDNGLKLMEHSWIGNNFVNAAYVLIHDNPHQVAWIGGYSDDVAEDFAIQAGGLERFNWFYKIAWKKDEDIRLGPEFFNNTDLDSFMTQETTGTYLINHTKKLFLSIEEYIRKNKKQESNRTDDIWCINPLPLLTACGNGQGGGDYRGINQDMVGSWAFNLLEYSDCLPVGYHKTMYNFIEE